MESQLDQLKRIRRESIKLLDKLRKLPRNGERDQIETEVLMFLDKIEREMGEVDCITGQANIEKSADDPE